MTHQAPTQLPVDEIAVTSVLSKITRDGNSDSDENDLKSLTPRSLKREIRGSKLRKCKGVVTGRESPPILQSYVAVGKLILCLWKHGSKLCGM